MAHDDMVSCPHCGGEIKRSARACPHCGSDEETGWSSNTYLDGIDLPEEASYEEILRNEFGNSVRHRRGLNRILFILITFLILAVIVAGILIALR